MDEIIKNLEFQVFHEFNYCEQFDILYQRDMSRSIKYDAEYYQKYITYEDSPIGIKLNNFRNNIVLKYSKSKILDIGIGSGTFIKYIQKNEHPIVGYDINPHGVKFLKENNLFYDPYEGISEEIDCVTFFDSLEHLTSPSKILNLVNKNCFVIVSIPVIKDLKQIKLSRHYRPDEHFYYFTEKGIINYFDMCGYTFIEISDAESNIGRDSIFTFVFKK